MKSTPAPLAPMIRLFDGTHVELLYRPGNADYALVTFDIMHARANGRTGFALKLAQNNDIPLYAVVPRKPHWYPQAELKKVSKIIAAHKDRPTIGYGASMGAYGVLRFGHLMNTDATLAFSPQINIDPAVTGAADRRYGRYYDEDLNGEMTVKAAHLGPKTTLIYDPKFAPDTYQQSLLRSGALNRITLPYMGHRAIATMKGSEVSLAVFAAALAGDHAKIRAILRQCRAQSADYHYGLAAALQHKPSRAIAILEHSAKTLGTTPETTVLRARMLSASGDHDTGIALLRTLVDANPHQVMYRRFLVDLLEAAGMPKEAADELETALSQSKNGVLAVRLSRLLHTLDPARAKAFDLTARETWPERAKQLGTS